MAAAASALLSDADVGFGAPATPATPAPKLLSDADVGFSPQGAAATPSGGAAGGSGGVGAPSQPTALSALLARPEGTTVTVHGHAPQPPDATSAFLSAVGGTPPPPPAAEDIAARVGNAVLQGYRNVPMDAILTPQAQDWVAKVSENSPRPNLQDVLTVGHALLAGSNAAFQGGLEGIAALGDAVGQPLLGRDVAGYFEAAGQTGAPQAGGLLRPTLPETRAALTERALAAGRTDQTAPAPEAPPITPPVANTNVVGGGRATMPLGTLVDAIVNAPTVDDAIKQAAGVVEKPNIGGAGAGTIAEQADRLDSAAQAEGFAGAQDKMAQQAVGAAAAPPAIVKQTESQISAAQMALERRMLNEPRIAGFDDTQYVPNESPLLHEIAGDPAVSLEAKQLMQDPKYAGRFADALRNNNLARTTFLNGTIGDAVDVDRMTAARDAAGDADRAVLWRNAQPVDAQPVVDAIDNILSGPAGKVDVVNSTLQKVKNGLYDPEENLETDPEILYGVRKNINTLLSKEASQQEPMNQHAAAQLMQVRNTLDGVISSGAPGFPDYLKSFADASKPIDAMQVLQDKFKNVFVGADRNITFQQFDNALKQVIKMRELPGANDAKSIPDAVMDALFSLDRSLGRATNIDLGKARGSDTVQNSRILGMAPEALAHAGAAIATGGNPLANLVVRAGAGFVKEFQAARVAASKDALVDKHINPSIPLSPPAVAGYTHGLPAITHTPLAANRAFY